MGSVAVASSRPVIVSSSPSPRSPRGAARIEAGCAGTDRAPVGRPALPGRPAPTLSGTLAQGNLMSNKHHMEHVLNAWSA
jgi:hypothetical protein